MRYAVLGDIHSNLEALDACLAAIDELDAEKILCVGDVIGYGPRPAEVIQALREREVVTVKGNHDAAVVGELDLVLFNPAARIAAEWTRDQLRPIELDWLEHLPLVATLEHCTLAHGAPEHPEKFPYVLNTDDARPHLDGMSLGVCFIGHTHVPLTILRHTDDPYRSAYIEGDRVDLGDAWRALINVGSVGQPRDEDPRTRFGLFDTESQTYELHRLEYDVDREVARVREAKLPWALGERLYRGL